MAFTCAGVRRSTPRSCFVKPPVEAPRQVIGFDLSPKVEKLGALPNLDDDDGDVTLVSTHSTCSNSCLISSKAAPTTATSPRSALQQLLLRPVDPQSEPDSSSPAANQIRVTHGPLLVEPACKPQAAKRSLTGGAQTSTKPYVEHDPVSAHGNWPIFKGIAELVGPSRCAGSIKDGRNGRTSAAAAAVSAIGCVAGIGERSRWVGGTIHELPQGSERNGNGSSWNIKDQLPPCREKSKKSSWMQEVMINNERPYSQHGKSRNVEISWKHANLNNPDQRTKKSSLFTLGASSPAADHSKRYPLHHNKDMDFLNSCYLCKRHLGQGHDAFMYSGDKAFCSMECRYQQIVLDERKERRAPSVIRSGSSPVYQSYMTSAGATAVATATASATTHHPITIMNPAAAA